MPTISQFYGIKITIFYDDHNEPHFHAYYGEYAAEISIKTGKIHVGRLPSHAIKLVKEWRKLHTSELREDWELARAHKLLKRIAPLE